MTVSYSANGRPQDQLSVLDEGAGAGQVGVSGANISFEGTVVGTYTGGTNGTNLVVTFNGAATENAVERVIEHLRYQSSGDGALPSRTVQISFRDAASATASDTVVINIAQEVDGAGPLFGDERVNSYLPGNQTRPAVSAFADGSYVVVWQSEGQDGNGLGVFGQRFTATGVPVGTEFAVNNWIGNDQSIPSVATLSGGGFVVTWASAGQDGWAGGIYAQRFDASGAKVGSEFRVNASTDGEQSQPMAIGLAGGGFVIAFSDDRVDSSGTGVFGQRYDASGVALGANFQINTYVPNTQYSPALAALKDDPATAATNAAIVADAVVPARVRPTDQPVSGSSTGSAAATQSPRSSGAPTVWQRLASSRTPTPKSSHEPIVVRSTGCTTTTSGTSPSDGTGGSTVAGAVPAVAIGGDGSLDVPAQADATSIDLGLSSDPCLRK